jgi:proteasome beta subunit
MTGNENGGRLGDEFLTPGTSSFSSSWRRTARNC